MGHSDAKALKAMGAYMGDMTNWRRHIHANPETAFEEVDTAAFVVERLRGFGVDEIHTGLATTGVVAIIKGKGQGERAIALRADMDALNMSENSGVEWASKRPGKHHACGHDGHTTMLLGAARHLAATRNFDGNVVLIFQPAEENEGGARVMVEEGLFKRFPVEAAFGMHNIPGIPTGQFAVRPGPFMASYDMFEITITGKGSHGAMPHHGLDPVVIGAELVQKLQTVVSRNVDPLQPAVLSVTQFHSGSAYNIIPNEALLAGTVRCFTPEVQAQMEQRIRTLCEGTALSHGVSIDIHYERRYPPTINHAKETAFCTEVAQSLVGTENVNTDPKPAMGSEDFAWMLLEVPGCYIWIGNGADGVGSCMVHNPGYDFNDSILTTGAAYWVKLVEKYLPLN